MNREKRNEELKKTRERISEEWKKLTEIEKNAICHDIQPVIKPEDIKPDEVVRLEKPTRREMGAKNEVARASEAMYAFTDAYDKLPQKETEFIEFLIESAYTLGYNHGYDDKERGFDLND